MPSAKFSVLTFAGCSLQKRFSRVQEVTLCICIRITSHNGHHHPSGALRDYSDSWLLLLPRWRNHWQHSNSERKDCMSSEMRITWKQSIS